MSRRNLGNFLASAAGLFACAVTIYISYTKLRVPQIPLDWAALIFSGLTTGIIAFFVVWGHFQKDPAPAGSEDTSHHFPVTPKEQSTS